MEVKRGTIRSLGSCNFCSRGELAKNGTPDLIYPYIEVTQFTKDGGGGLLANICDQCLTELANKKIDYHE